MKYWQRENGKKATRSNVPHLYLYTWIRASFWFILSLNSMVMLFITKENSIFDNLIPRENFFCIITAIGSLMCMTLPFDHRKVFRTLDRVIIDVFLVGIVLFLYVFGNVWIIALYIVELAIIVCYGIQIDRDDRIVDNNRIVLWWKQKEREHTERQVQRFLDKRELKKVELTEEQKLKRMSRKQRKEYLQKNNK